MTALLILAAQSLLSAPSALAQSYDYKIVTAHSLYNSATDTWHSVSHLDSFVAANGAHIRVRAGHGWVDIDGRIYAAAQTLGDISLNLNWPMAGYDEQVFPFDGGLLDPLTENAAREYGDLAQRRLFYAEDSGEQTKLEFLLQVEDRLFLLSTLLLAGAEVDSAGATAHYIRVLMYEAVGGHPVLDAPPATNPDPDGLVFGDPDQNDPDAQDTERRRVPPWQRKMTDQERRDAEKTVNDLLRCAETGLHCPSGVDSADLQDFGPSGTDLFEDNMRRLAETLVRGPEYDRDGWANDLAPEQKKTAQLSHMDLQACVELNVFCDPDVDRGALVKAKNSFAPDAFDVLLRKMASDRVLEAAPTD